MKKYRIVNPQSVRRAKVGNRSNQFGRTARAKKQGNRTNNPTRKLSLAQKLHFGTARQRASAKRILSGKHKRRVNNPKHPRYGYSDNKKVIKAFKSGQRAKSQSLANRQFVRFYKKNPRRLPNRASNPAEIITLTNPGSYSTGTRKSKSKRKSNLMARRKRTTTRRRTTHRRRSNPGLAVTRRRSIRRSNPGISRTRRRRNGYASRRRTRNPGQLTGGFNAAFGVIGGAVITNMVTSRLPAGWNTGFMGYAATAVVAVAQGSLAGKVFKNAQLGKNMTIGGLAVLVMKLLGDFMPGFSSPFGMGTIVPSSFNLPQVLQNNSMNQFVTPAGLQQVINTNAASGMAGIGRRGGRMR